MIGIGAIAVHLPDHRISNRDRLATFNVTADFMHGKVGMLELARKGSGEETSDLCVAAARRLFDAHAVDASAIDCCVVVTQNPDDFGLPHTAAIVHGKLGLPAHCATFDVSLGCSGYVHALSIVSAYMEANCLRRGLLLTADPYSKVIDPADRDTAMLFGDAATATLLTDEPTFAIGRFDIGTDGTQSGALKVTPERKLHMNGRAVFTFCATQVPGSIQRALERNGTTLGEVDVVLLHQGSRYIVDTVAGRLGVCKKAPFLAADYGNTVSSSIPIMLARDVRPEHRRIVISGFGVGLCWATTVLTRTGLLLLTEQDVRTVIAKAVANYDASRLGRDTPFDEAGIDSLDHLSVLLALKESFRLTVPDEDVGRCRSIAGILEYAAQQT